LPLPPCDLQWSLHKCCKPESLLSPMPTFHSYNHLNNHYIKTSRFKFFFLSITLSILSSPL
jgi:hypothetical protein